MFEQDVLDFRVPLSNSNGELLHDKLHPRRTPPQQPHTPPSISVSPMLTTPNKVLMPSPSDMLSQGQPIEGLVHRMRRQTLQQEPQDNNGLVGLLASGPDRTATVPAIPLIPEPLVVDDAPDFTCELEVDPELDRNADQEMMDSAMDDIILPVPSSFLRSRVPSLRRRLATNSRIESYLDSITMPYQSMADHDPPPPSPKSSTPPSATLSEFELPIVPDDNAKLGEPEFDEGFCDGQDPAAWMESMIAGRSMRFLKGQASSGIQKRYPTLTYRSSQDAAMQCANVVKNVPRMRRRKGDKPRTKGSRSRATSAASSVAPKKPHTEPVPQLPLPEPQPLSSLGEEVQMAPISSPARPLEASLPPHPVQATSHQELPCLMEVEGETDYYSGIPCGTTEQLQPSHNSCLLQEEKTVLLSTHQPPAHLMVEVHGMQREFS